MTADMSADIDWTGIAAEYGTPTYVYDGDALLSNLAELRAVLHADLEVFFSLKSNPNRSIYDVLRSGGARAEVSSLAELRLVLGAGTPPGDVIFLGPGKSDAEIDACVEAGIYAVVCESFGELTAIDEAAERYGVRQRVMLRVNPAYAVSGSRLTMGGKPRQFGIDEAEVMKAGSDIAALRHADVAGVHVYMGTRILEHTAVVANTTYALDLAERVAQATGIRLDVVDIGGGLGVAYFDNEHDLDVAALAAELNPLIDRFVAAHPGTRMIMESGRFLTARAGTYLMRVRYVKQSMGENFAIADGGTHHHMAAVGIGSFVKRNFPIELLSRAGGEAERWNVTGPLCTPNDTVAKNAALPALAPGDLLGVRRSGAYGPSASPVYFLSHGYPAEVLLLRGRSYLARPRDTVEDVLGKQLIHPDLSLPKEITMTPTTDIELREVLRNALGDILQREIPELDDGMRLFDQLGLDSTGVIELLMALEDSVGLQIDPDDLTPEVFETVGSLTDYIRVGLRADQPVG